MLSSSVNSLIVSAVVAVETFSSLEIKDNLIDLHFMKDRQYRRSRGEGLGD